MPQPDAERLRAANAALDTEEGKARVRAVLHAVDELTAYCERQGLCINISFKRQIGEVGEDDAEFGLAWESAMN